MFLTAFSCKKEINKQYPIKNWTINMDAASKLRTELRLAFGKTVANMLKNQNFRNYFYKISQNQHDSIFNEIVFSMHQNDLVDGTKTFAQLLRENVDLEVKSIFGDSLIEMALDLDPCVCLKIPDLLYDVPWNPNDFAPCVYVETPTNLDGFQDYMVYHYSGYQSLINDFEITKPEHYYIMVKYSEDYTLIDINTWYNEKAISFFEFLPQLKENWNDLQSLILGIAIPSSYGPDKKFIPKYKAYQIWSEEYSYTGPLLSQTPGCGENCLRDCAKLTNFVPTILDHIQVNNDLFYYYLGSIFRESSSLLFGFWGVTDNFRSLFAIPSLRYRKMGFKIMSYKLNVKCENFENITNTMIPYLSISYYDKLIENNIPVNYIVLPKMKPGFIQYSIQYCFYNDIVVPNCLLSGYPENIKINTSLCPIPGIDIYSYCEKPLQEEISNDVSLYFNY